MLYYLFNSLVEMRIVEIRGDNLIAKMSFFRIHFCGVFSLPIILMSASFEGGIFYV